MRPFIGLIQDFSVSSDLYHWTEKVSPQAIKAQQVAEILDIPLNETNSERLFGIPNLQPYVKDAFHNYLVHGQTQAVNPGPDRHQGGRPIPARSARRGCGSGAPAAH
jgi:hypothetical protein